MEKYKNIEEYLEDNSLYTREDLKEMMLRSAIDLLTFCSDNFGGDAKMTENAVQPIFFLNNLLDNVE